MASVVRGFVEGIGISDSYPVCPKYFTELTIPETIVIPEEKPDAEQLMSIMVEPEIISTRLVDTPVGTSHEGQNLAGCKLIIELKLRQKIKYVADNEVQSVHAAHFDKVISSIFVVLPCTIGGISVKELLRKHKLTITPYIEDIYGELRDKRTIFKNVALLINVTGPCVSVFDFPSAESTVVANIGFINDVEIGYFWSVDNGQRVSQTFTSGGCICGATLDVEVVQNYLIGGAFVDWELVINGVVVGSFTVEEGFTGPITLDASFPPIMGPVYNVDLRVTNQVPLGQGSITLAYASDLAHTLTLKCCDSDAAGIQTKAAVRQTMRAATRVSSGVQYSLKVNNREP